MTNLMEKEYSDFMTDIQHSFQLTQTLMKMPHYSRFKEEELFGIIEAAKAYNVDLRQALSGGFHYIKGKVEMSAHLMSSIIRKHGHSFVQDEKSNDTICILHGKRGDTGDTWTSSFTIKEAEEAGLMNNHVWKHFRKDMLFARTIKRLSNCLYSDLFRNVLGEGELSLDPNIPDVPNILYTETATPSLEKKELPTKISNEEIADLESLIGNDDNYRQKVLCFLENNNLGRSFHDMSKEIYDKVCVRALKNKQEREKVIQDTCQQDEINQMAMGDS